LSGCSYKHWRDGFYEGLPQRLEFERYAKQFAMVEVNATFYGANNAGLALGLAVKTEDGLYACTSCHQASSTTTATYFQDGSSMMSMKDGGSGKLLLERHFILPCAARFSC
jgi:hypothetical protein